MRMGLHTGEASLGSAATGADYVGYDVHRAARIANAGHGGQVLLSEAVSLLVRDALPARVTLRDLGEHRFKDLGRPERVLQVVIDGLPADFPPIRSLDLVPNNLPMQVTSFIGREREIAEGVKLFQQTRLLTLTGPGGTGKTRLSLQIAAQRGRRLPGRRLLRAAGAGERSRAGGAGDRRRPAPGDRPELAARPRCCSTFAIGPRCWCSTTSSRCCRRRRWSPICCRASAGLKVIASVARRAAHLGRAGDAGAAARAPRSGRSAGARCPSTRRCGCSSSGRGRRPAGLRGRQRQRAGGRRDLRAPGRAAAGDRAGRGARQAAAARRHPGAPRESPRRCCARGARDLPDRQQTLRGAIAWSHDLLDEAAQRLFARLAVFAGGGALDDVEAICGGPDLGIDVLEGLEALVDQSLVRQEQHGAEARAGDAGDDPRVRARAARRQSRRGRGAQPPRAALPGAGRGGRAAPAARRAPSLAGPPRARARQPARGVRLLRRLRAHRRGAAPGGRDVAFLAVPRSPARGAAARPARARRSRVARPPRRARAGARGRGRPRLLARRHGGDDRELRRRAGARARQRRPAAHLERALQPLLHLRLGAGRQEPRRAGRPPPRPRSKKRWPWPARSAIGAPSPAACGPRRTPRTTCATTRPRRGFRCARRSRSSASSATTSASPGRCTARGCRA